MTHVNVQSSTSIPFHNAQQHQTVQGQDSMTAAVVTQTFTEVQSSVTSTQPQNALYPSILSVQQ